MNSNLSNKPFTSASSLTVDWQIPDILSEHLEFGHPAKQEFYLKHNITWETLSNAASQGIMVPCKRDGLIEGIPISLCYHTYDDYLHYLAKAKRGYRKSYDRMEKMLQREGNISLPAAIIVAAGSEALLFSGYRRLSLAWNYGMIPYVFLVNYKEVS